MRLLEQLPNGQFCLTEKFLNDAIPRYGILSHTWGSEEVTYEDVIEGTGRTKSGYAKIKFCGEQAANDGLRYFWVDSCCIKRSSDSELSESLNSMFRYYHRAEKCYVYLSDVSRNNCEIWNDDIQDTWDQSFRTCKWFTRGWTLQELLAPRSVEFFTYENSRLGNKVSLEQQIHEITGIPKSALRGSLLSMFTTDEKFEWARNRQTTREEDWAYSLLGLFEVSMPVIYGEGKVNAVRRLRKEIDDASMDGESSEHLCLNSTCQIASADMATAHDAHQRLPSVSFLVQQTQHAFLSTNLSLQRHLARIYNELGQQQALLRQLEVSVEDYARSRYGRPPICADHCEHLSKTCCCFHTEINNTEEFDSISADIFFDCASRFSHDDSPASIDRLGINFTGSPAYILETKKSFYPELYGVTALFSDPLFVLAMKQSYTQNKLAHQYYLLYAQTPRCWQRVIVSATFEDFKDLSAIPQVSVPDIDEFTCKMMPNFVKNLLSDILPQTQLFSSVTKISIYLVEGEAGTIIQKLPQLKSAEDCLEVEILKEDDILRDIEIMGCPIFPESEIQVMSQRSSTCFEVKVAGQTFLQKKIGFASAGWDNGNGLSDFINDLKLLHFLQGCRGIPRLIGVVFDDARLHLKGYLYEAPMIYRLIRVFYLANLRSEMIPWSIRELWSKQSAQALADVHSKGLTVGLLGRQKIGLRADGSAVLFYATSSKMNMDYDAELMPPELRIASNNGTYQQLNDRTDIYQLGLILWLIAEQRGNTDGIRCSRNACTNIPRYQCTADHMNPAHLPPCSGSVPLYFSNIIQQCRSLNPKERPTARRIAQILSSRGDSELCCLRDTLEAVKEFEKFLRYLVHCDECGGEAPEFHYHCYTCNFGNFDLCTDCVEILKLDCPVPEHKLVKRMTKDGGFVNVS